MLHHLSPKEVAEAGRVELLAVRRGIDQVDHSQEGPHDVLCSLLALLRRDQLQVVLEQGVERSHDLVELVDHHVDGRCAHLGEDVQVEHNTLLSGVSEATCDDSVDNAAQVDAVCCAVLQGLKELESGLAHGKTMIDLVLERTKVDFLDELLPDLGLIQSEG